MALWCDISYSNGLTLAEGSTEIALTLVGRGVKIALTLICEVLYYGFLSEC